MLQVLSLCCEWQGRETVYMLHRESRQGKRSIYYQMVSAFLCGAKVCN